MLRHGLVNRLWTAGNRRHAWRQRRAEQNPRAVQLKILREFLRRNAASAYGQAHGYGTISSVDEYRRRVPVVEYDELEPWIHRILAGEPEILTTEPVQALEPSSGSSGATKYIPYTRSLLTEFRQAVGAWMHDLFTGRPRLREGSHYWCLTPLRPRQETTGGIPLGFESDLDYFGRFDRWCLGHVVETPEGAATASDVEECLVRTAAHLARCPDLRFISAWCPSFLTLLADSLPGGATPRDLWPRLEIVSCWTSAGSRRHLPALQARFPGIEIQGKGLLATEGVVSFPRLGHGSPVPALAAHFLEFIDDTGKSHLVDELASGERYSVVITTGGGFARYRLGDRVEARALGPSNVPGVEFIGREGHLSDLCGEKLNENYVRTVVEEATRTFELPGAPFVAPEWGSPPHYVVFVESAKAPEVARWIETRLRDSYHYDYCRSLGQLGALEGVTVEEGRRHYLRGCEALGQRAGDAKSTCLRRELGWRERMAAHAHH